MHKFDLHKSLRISTWVLRFINSCRKNKETGPVTTVELVNQKKIYIKREQEKVVSSDRFEDDKKRLNLKKNDEGVYMCKERLQGFYLIYLPQESVLSKKANFAEHKRSLHGGVAITMSHVRSLFWIPHLTLFRMGGGGGGGGQKGLTYQFFPYNFYKRRIWSPKLPDF